MNFRMGVLVIAMNFVAWFAHADSMPDCMAKGQSLAVNNAQVINWKSTTQNQFQSRGHIQGQLTKVYPDHSGHHHFEVQIGSNPNDTIEVIYNEAFGAIPTIAPGVEVEACGDYITSNKATGSYPASPDGAILHWVHQAPNAGHESGYVAINGVVYGQGAGNAGPKPPHHH
jgi:hypothetical protein